MEGSAYKMLHHEVLMALAGYPGNLFMVPKDSGVLELVPGLPFVHPSERELLNKICRLGTYYLHLKEFVTEQNRAIFQLPFQDSAIKGGRLYLKSLAYSLDCILNEYRQHLASIEQKFIHDPHLPLSHLTSSLERYQTLLPSLEQSVSQILRDELRGGQVLSLLHDHCSSGVPDIRKAYEKILAGCHGVLYKQLSGWMLHGLLPENGEFFIEPTKRGKEAQVPISEEEDDPLSKSKGEDKPVGLGDSSSLFTICHQLVPSYLPMRIIEKILFVGEAVQIFQMRAHGKRDLSTLLTGAGSELRSDQIRFGQQFADLQREPLFKLRDFESVVDRIRDCVAERLWKLLVEDSHLIAHLQIIKDFFLLGRGELFLTFFDLAHSFMKSPPTITTSHDVNVAFQQAMLKVSIDKEELMKQFKLTLPESSLRQAVRGAEGVKGKEAWQLLGMTHSVEWPLHILFSPLILERYNVIFQFLLLLRRTQIRLQQCWAVFMQCRDRLDELKGVWELRTHMGFLVDNLLYYVQVDVLESQFSQLLDRVNSTHDFESIKHAHESFVTALQSQLFLTLPTVHQCLLEITNQCNIFSSVIEQRSDLSLTAQDRETVDRITRDFNRQASLFFRVVSSLHSHQSSTHLTQLLLRVDYNKYFSTTLAQRT